MSEKQCTHHKDKRRKRIRSCFAGILIILFLLLVIFLITWAILQPRKPRFILQDATLYNFNVSSPNMLTSYFQFTIYARNPNDKIGIYYDRLDAYATYHNQQITYYTGIPPVYQGHKDYNVWSPFVSGNNVPVAPYNALSLSQDQANGAINLNVRIDGRIKWKVGTVTTGRYHVHVSCPAYIPFGNRNSGVVIGNAVKFQLQQSCSVSV